MSIHDDHQSELMERLARAIDGAPDLTELLRGTVRQRYVRCGKKGCHCEDGDGHGPVYYLSTSVAGGRTKQVALTEEDYQVARRYVENYGRLRKIIEEVSEVNRELLRERRRRRRQGHD